MSANLSLRDYENEHLITPLVKNKTTTIKTHKKNLNLIYVKFSSCKVSSIFTRGETKDSITCKLHNETFDIHNASKGNAQKQNLVTYSTANGTHESTTQETRR